MFDLLEKRFSFVHFVFSWFCFAPRFYLLMKHQVLLIVFVLLAHQCMLYGSVFFLLLQHDQYRVEKTIENFSE